MFVCMYTGMYLYIYVFWGSYNRMDVWMNICMHVCVYVCLYVCQYVCMYICTYVNIYVHICIRVNIGSIRSQDACLLVRVLSRRFDMDVCFIRMHSCVLLCLTE